MWNVSQTCLHRGVQIGEGSPAYFLPTGCGLCHFRLAERTRIVASLFVMFIMMLLTTILAWVDTDNCKQCGSLCGNLKSLLGFSVLFSQDSFPSSLLSESHVLWLSVCFRLCSSGELSFRDVKTFGWWTNLYFKARQLLPSLFSVNWHWFIFKKQTFF